MILYVMFKSNLPFLKKILKDMDSMNEGPACRIQIAINFKRIGKITIHRECFENAPSLFVFINRYLNAK